MILKFGHPNKMLKTIWSPSLIILILLTISMILTLSILGIVDLQTTDNSVLAVLAREHDAKGERGVGDVVEIVLLKCKIIN